MLAASFGTSIITMSTDAIGVLIRDPTTYELIRLVYMGKSLKHVMIFVMIFLELFIGVVCAPCEAHEPD